MVDKQSNQSCSLYMSVCLYVHVQLLKLDLWDITDAGNSLATDNISEYIKVIWNENVLTDKNELFRMDWLIFYINRYAICLV